MSMSLHHVGVAVADIDAGARQFRALYRDVIAREKGPVHDPLQEADLLLFELRDGSRIELVSGKPAQAALKRGGNYHHVCYEVESVAAAIAEWQHNGAIIVSGPSPAVLFDGRTVAFVYTALGLVEFLNRA